MKLCLFVLFMFFIAPLFAQSQKGIIYLKNGSVINGKYLLSNDLKKLKVETEGNVWVFNASEIDSISQRKTTKLSYNTEQDPVSSIFFRTEIGLLIGNSENSQSAPFSLTGSLNYTVAPNISVGGGLGVEFLKETYMPVFINLEYKMRDSYTTPFFFLKAGYQIAIDESREMYYPEIQPWSSFAPWPDYNNEPLDAEGGLLINPGIGYQKMFSYSFGMSLAFGYQFHGLNYSGEKDYGLDIDYNRLTVKIGITFK